MTTYRLYKEQQGSDIAPIIAVDYDGTLVDEKWPDHGDWKPGAVEALHTLRKFSRPIIYTMRASPVWLDGRPMEKTHHRRLVNEVYEQLASVGIRDIEVYTGPGKLGAFRYIDDRAINYNGRPGAWKALTQRIAALCGYNLEDE